MTQRIRVVAAVFRRHGRPTHADHRHGVVHNHDHPEHLHDDRDRDRDRLGDEHAHDRQMHDDHTLVEAEPEQVRDDRERVFACRRAPGTSQAGLWEFPGGKVEPGETPQAALAREIAEELGIEVKVHGLLDRTATRVGDRIIDLACYEVSCIQDDPLQSTDHDAFRWLTSDELDDVVWAAPDLPAVEVLRRTLR